MCRLACPFPQEIDMTLCMFTGRYGAFLGIRKEFFSSAQTLLVSSHLASCADGGALLYSREAHKLGISRPAICVYPIFLEPVLHIRLSGLVEIQSLLFHYLQHLGLGRAV